MRFHKLHKIAKYWWPEITKDDPHPALKSITEDPNEEGDEGEEDEYEGFAFPGCEMPTGNKWQAIDDQIEGILEQEEHVGVLGGKTHKKWSPSAKTEDDEALSFPEVKEKDEDARAHAVKVIEDELRRRIEENQELSTPRHQKKIFPEVILDIESTGEGYTVHPCQNCEAVDATVTCVQCALKFCDACNDELHAIPKAQLHKRVDIRSLIFPDVKADYIPDQDDDPITQMTMGVTELEAEIDEELEEIFPSVYGTHSMIDAKKPEAVEHCGICEKQEVAMACIQCGFGFCLSCAQSFHSRGKMRDHDLVVLASSVSTSDNNSPMLTPGPDDDDAAPRRHLLLPPIEMKAAGLPKVVSV